MDYRLLGQTGIEVSRIALGCGNFGGIGSAPELFGQGENEPEAFRLMDVAWESGITLFDTADAYGGGRSEATIGKWLAGKGPDVRDRIVLASKVLNPVGDDPRDLGGLSHERILRQIEGSLRRLGVERLDLYLIHGPDPDVPIEETLGAFDALVRAGKVRAIGASNVDATLMREALDVSAARRLTRFEWVQNEFSLLARGDEEELLPLCAAEGLGYTPFSPLAGGWLTGKYRRGKPYPAGSRMTLRPGPYRELESDATYDRLEAFEEVGGAAGVDMATAALAWVLSHPHVTGVVLGPRRPEHLEPALRALGLDLTPADRDGLAAVFAA